MKIIKTSVFTVLNRHYVVQFILFAKKYYLNFKNCSTVIIQYTCTQAAKKQCPNPEISQNFKLLLLVAIIGNWQDMKLIHRIIPGNFYIYRHKLLNPIEKSITLGLGIQTNNAKYLESLELSAVCGSWEHQVKMLSISFPGE